MEEINKKITNCKKYIIEVLKKADVYAPEIAYQVDQLARDLLIYRKLYNEVMRLDTTTCTKMDQFGNEILYAHPAVTQYKQMAIEVRKDLGSLYMNRDKKRHTANEGQDDILQQIMNFNEE